MVSRLSAESRAYSKHNRKTYAVRRQENGQRQHDGMDVARLTLHIDLATDRIFPVFSRTRNAS